MSRPVPLRKRIPNFILAFVFLCVIAGIYFYGKHQAQLKADAAQASGVATP